MTPNVRFQTDRLEVQSWDAAISALKPRQSLAKELTALLTPNVTRHLPGPLQLPVRPNAIDDWITERQAESAVFTLRGCESLQLFGLLIIATSDEGFQGMVMRLGYLFAQEHWGQGLATEMLHGFIAWGQSQQVPICLLAGIEIANTASARVLRKAGFSEVSEKSTAGHQVFKLQL